MRWIADIIYVLVGVLYLPVLLYQAVFLAKNRRGWSERFGWVRPFHQRASHPGGERCRIWIHAVSLGEINATPLLVEELEQSGLNVEVVISTTTDTGFARALQLYGRDRVFRYPLDFSRVVSRVLDRVKPSLIVLVELEVWFNLITIASQRGIPVAVINGRLTERSAARFGWLGLFRHGMFNKLSWVGAQDVAIAKRFETMGVARDRIEVTSSMKWDSATVCDEVDGAQALAKAMGITRNRAVWVCGSTGPGEEAMLLQVYQRILHDWSGSEQSVQPNGATGPCKPAPVLVIVPRKPERFGDVARLIGTMGFDCLRRSECVDGSIGTLRDRCVVLGDTMGELRKFYSLANAVFVGRTLVPMGGSDPMEVAALGKPILVGPHTDNFSMPIAALSNNDAVCVVKNEEELASKLLWMLRDEPDSAADLGTRGRRVVLENQGATKRTVEGLARLLEGDCGTGHLRSEAAART